MEKLSENDKLWILEQEILFHKFPNIRLKLQFWYIREIIQQEFYYMWN